MLSRCFMCKSKEDLQECHDVKVCGACSSKTFTKSELRDGFSITAKEANDVLHFETEHGYYKSTVYIFNFKDTASACNKKFGCLSNFVREQKGWYHADVLRA